MSNISGITNRHQFTKLEKNSRPLSGQRLVRLIAKKDKDGNYASDNLRESLAISIPPADSEALVNAIPSLIVHIQSMIEGVQKELISEYRIKTGDSSVDESEFTIAKCVEYLDAASTGSRLTTEYLQQWFSENYSDAAKEFIATALKLNSDASQWMEEQVKIVNSKVNLIRDMFSGFASARYSPDIPKCKAMIKFGEFLGEGNVDSRMEKFLEKAAKIKEEKENEMSADALGF